ncbi:hypothetical protein [Vogesella indigofera]|uniref:hypothetical protein n=1 Tax=Vogesella indigofera TaxID=45465 RepID=UPI003F42926D
MINLQAKPTPSVVVFIVIFTIMSLFPNLEDPDFYWHLKTGELIVSSGQLPWHDIFTFTSYGNQWVLSEWLSQVVFFLAYQLADLHGIAILTALIFTLCWITTYKTCLDILEDEGKAVIVLILFCGAMGAIAPRPHIFTFLFFSIILRKLFYFKYKHKDINLISIPLVMVLWANMHGGFFIGIILMISFTATEWIRYLASFEKDSTVILRLKKLSLVATLGLMATAVNPDGFHYWLYPYQAIVSSGDTTFISEWQSPNFHQPFYQYFLIIVFLYFINMAYSQRKADITEAMVPLIFIGGAFFSVRNLPLAGLVMAPHVAIFYRELMLTEALSNLKLKHSRTAEKSQASSIFGRFVSSGNKQVGESEAVINWIIMIASVVAIGLHYPNRKKEVESRVSDLLPVKAVDFVVKNKIQGNIFNTYHYGGYLIHRLHPEQKIFVYGRTDIYKMNFINEYLEMYSGGKNWEKYFYKNKIDYVICETSAPIKQLLLLKKDFKLVFDDGKHSVLLKDTAKYQSLIKQYAPGLQTHDMGSIALSSSNESEG